MTDEELSGRARALLDQAVAEEQALSPDLAHRRRLKRAMLQGAALAGAGGAATAKAAGAPLLALGKSIGVGLLVSGSLLGGAELIRSPAASPSAADRVKVAPAPVRSAPAPLTVPVASSTSEPFVAPPSSPAVAPPTPSAPTSATPALREELQLLSDAQRALRDGKASEALSLLARYDDRFPSGQLSSERLAVEVFAACALGDRARATRAAERFLQRDSSSGLAERVKRACPFPQEGEAP